MSRLTASPFHKPAAFVFPKVPVSPPETLTDNGYPSTAAPQIVNELRQEENTFSTNSKSPSHPRIRPSISYQNSGLRENTSRPVHRSYRFFVVVIPPLTLIQEHGQLGHTLASGPPQRLAQGIIMPLFPTMYGQLTAIAREFNFPSTTGLCLYLHFNESGVVMTPRISEESWYMLWNHLFETPSAPRGPPIGGKVEFDIDFRQARWYSSWLSTLTRDRIERPFSHVPSTAPSFTHARGESRNSANEYDVPEPDQPVGHFSRTPSVSNTVRHVPRKLSLVDRFDIPAAPAESKAATVQNLEPSDQGLSTSKVLSPIAQEEEPQSAREELDSRVRSWRAGAIVKPTSLTGRGQTSLEPINLPNNLSVDGDALSYTWSISSVGPEDYDLISADTPSELLPSPDLAHRMIEDCPPTPSTATSWGPPLSYPASPLSEYRPPSLDLGFRSIFSRPLTPATATSWGPESPVMPSYGWHDHVSRPASVHLGDRGDFSRPVTPSTATSWGAPLSYPPTPITPFYVATPDAAQRSFDLAQERGTPAVRPWSFVWPYLHTREQQPWQLVWPYFRACNSDSKLPQRSLDPAQGHGTVTKHPWPFAWPYLHVREQRPWQLVWPYFRACNSDSELPRRSLDPAQGHGTVTRHPWPFAWPYLQMREQRPWQLVWPYFRACDSDSELPRRSLDPAQGHGTAAQDPWPFVWPYLRACNDDPEPEEEAALLMSPVQASGHSQVPICSTVYPYFDLYPVAAVPRGSVWNIITVKVTFDVQYPALHTYPPVYPHNLDMIYPTVSEIDKQHESIPIATSQYPIFNLYPAIYPNFDLYPMSVNTTFDSATEAETPFHHSYPSLVIYPTVYPHLEIFPAKAAEVLETRVSVKAGELKTSLSIQYPNFDIYPPAYPNFNIYPVCPATDTVKNPIIVCSSQYPVFDLYPAVYPHFNIYPPRLTVLERGSAKQLVTVILAQKYPVFNLYPAMYPDFIVYPPISGEIACNVDELETPTLRTMEFSYPVVCPYPPVYPYFDLYPSTLHREMKNIREGVVLLSRATAYPTFDLYPAAYPTIRVYPSVAGPVEGSRGATMMQTVRSYPHFEIYPSVYPHFNIYPPHHCSKSHMVNVIPPGISVTRATVRSRKSHHDLHVEIFPNGIVRTPSGTVIRPELDLRAITIPSRQNNRRIAATRSPTGPSMYRPAIPPALPSPSRRLPTPPSNGGIRSPNVLEQMADYVAGATTASPNGRYTTRSSPPGASTTHRASMISPLRQMPLPRSADSSKYPDDYAINTVRPLGLNRASSVGGRGRTPSIKPRIRDSLVMQRVQGYDGFSCKDCRK